MKNFIITNVIIAILYVGFFCCVDVLAVDLININTATAVELESLPGIGATKAQAIIDYRNQFGNFTATEEIKNVSGIGDATFNNIKDLITVQAQVTNTIDTIKININNADLILLQTLPGIGATKAQAIIDYRNQFGNFTATEEIKNVSGIGDATFSNIKDLITVGVVQFSAPLLADNHSELTSSSTVDNGVNYKFGDVVINEFVSDPADGEVEFVELFNKTSRPISLVGWSLFDGSGNQTVLAATLDVYYVIEQPHGNLNNAGDGIILKFGTKIIDQIYYGNWPGGGVNALAPTDPRSAARKGDGYNTFNTANDFAITDTITKGSANIITDPEQNFLNEYSAPSLDYDYTRDVLISEIFPNPVGADNVDEFIELFNNSDQSVNMTGWRLSDATSKKYELKNLIIPAKSYTVIYRKDSGLALNNDFDLIELFQPLVAKPLQIVKYDDAKEGWSYGVVNATTTPLVYSWSETITPALINSVKIINHPPLVDFSYSGELRVGQIVSFDSSDTIDEDKDKLFFTWNLDNIATSSDANTMFIFLDPGVKQISLEVSDGKQSVKVEKLIEVVVNDDTFMLANTNQPVYVSLSEFLPNPEGADTDGEWIELYNNSDALINLSGWKIDDGNGGSSPYVIKNLTLPARGFGVIGREESKVALNNSSDSVRLFNSIGSMFDEVAYSSPKEGYSYALIDGVWAWTNILTPDRANEGVGAGIVMPKPPLLAKSNKIVTATNNREFVNVDLTTIRQQHEAGDYVRVTGVVAVEPGIFGVQYFYIVGSPGIQIYNYNKLFPVLKVGDQVAVSGELSESYGELRLKTKIAADINILATSTLPEPIMIEADKIGENTEGWLVRVKGEVVEKKGSTIFLDDGTNEAEIYIKQGSKINKSNIYEGDVLAVVGIVTQKNEIYRIFPRSPDDIIVENAKPAGEVLGVVSAQDEWVLTTENKQLKMTRYLLIIAAALIFILAGLLWRYKIKS